MSKKGPLAGLQKPFSKAPPGRHTVHQNRREIVDGRPLEAPLGYKRSPTLTEQIRAMVQGEALAYAAKNAGAETFEEADDFEVEDDFDPTSPYEEVFEPPPTWDSKQEAIGEAVARGMELYNEKVKARDAKKKKKAPVEGKKEEKPDVKPPDK